MGVKNLPNVDTQLLPRVGFEPVTCWSQVQRSTCCTTAPWLTVVADKDKNLDNSCSSSRPWASIISWPSLASDWASVYGWILLCRQIVITVGVKYWIIGDCCKKNFTVKQVVKEFLTKSHIACCFVIKDYKMVKWYQRSHMAVDGSVPYRYC